MGSITEARIPEVTASAGAKCSTHRIKSRIIKKWADAHTTKAVLAALMSVHVLRSQESNIRKSMKQEKMHERHLHRGPV